MIIYILMLNLLAWTIFGFDKLLALHHRERIQEYHLLLLAFLGGSLGAIMGMIMFRHKIAKKSFVIKLALIILVQGGIFALIVKDYEIW